MDAPSLGGVTKAGGVPRKRRSLKAEENPIVPGSVMISLGELHLQVALP